MEQQEKDKAFLIEKYDLIDKAQKERDLCELNKEDFKEKLKDTSFSKLKDFVLENEDFFNDYNKRITINPKECEVIIKIIGEYLEIKTSKPIELEVKYKYNKDTDFTSKVFIRKNGIFFKEKYYERNTRVRIENNSWGYRNSEVGIKNILLNPQFIEYVLDLISDKQKKENLKILLDTLKFKLESANDSLNTKKIFKQIGFKNILDKEDTDKYLTYMFKLNSKGLALRYARKDKIEEELNDLKEGEEISDYRLSDFSFDFDNDKFYTREKSKISLSILYELQDEILNYSQQYKTELEVKRDRLLVLTKEYDKLLSPYLALEEL